jgi:hypothetical protein
VLRESLFCCAEFLKVLAGFSETQISVWSTNSKAFIQVDLFVVILSVVFPETDGTDVIASTLAKRLVFAAWAAEAMMSKRIH